MEVNNLNSGVEANATCVQTSPEANEAANGSILQNETRGTPHESGVELPRVIGGNHEDHEETPSQFHPPTEQHGGHPAAASPQAGVLSEDEIRRRQVETAIRQGIANAVIRRRRPLCGRS